MTQNTEQNVRTRDEQVASYFRTHCAWHDGFSRSDIEAIVKEAEARGAAEQRRKDAEGAIHIVFDGFPSPDGPKFVEVENPKGFSISVGEWRKRNDGLCELVILGQYEGLAVLGAKNDLLEARVKELEEAKGKKQEDARRYRNALMNICEKTSEFSISHKVSRAALARAGDPA